jgi:hypothetical protein
MILIYTHSITTRLQYICQFIFKEQLDIEFTLTTNAAEFKNADKPKINYSQCGDVDSTDGFKIKNENLLFEIGIQEQYINCFETEQYKAFFKTNDSDFAFDIFAASFYLISRYEEYLPYNEDMYGRYGHKNSLAFNAGFLNIPLVNIWLIDFAKVLQNYFPTLEYKFPSFKFVPTYDVDIAWSYKNKGLFRNIGGFLKAPSFDRLKVLLGLSKDPYDSFLFLDELHNKYNLQPIYFFLVASRISLYDKNNSPYGHGMWQLMKRHAKKYTLGIHPSWRSNENEAKISKEIKLLQTAANVPITKSRQHYIKLKLPDTFENLIEQGIIDEYSMGYGSINGFRASTASSFFWYNLQQENITTLRINPFCYMDANCYFEQQQTVENAFTELVYYYNICKKNNGNFISIFHNNFLGSDKQFAGWKTMYQKFITQL